MPNISTRRKAEALYRLLDEEEGGTANEAALLALIDDIDPNGEYDPFVGREEEPVRVETYNEHQETSEEPAVEEEPEPVDEPPSRYLNGSQIAVDPEHAPEPNPNYDAELAAYRSTAHYKARMAAFRERAKTRKWKPL